MTCRSIGLGGGRYQAIQYAGQAVYNLSMQERMTMSNMAAELGAQAGLIAPDEITAEYINNAGGALPQDWQTYQIETQDLDGEVLRFDAAG